ncbi:MAG: VOC family protein [Leptolyngbya sp. SIO1D8]|nr:VOC family protein [Leptolyngbya sp. SIO1D8]
METNHSATDTPPKKAGLHLKRPCLLVSDLERSLKVYRDILGFRLDYVSEASPESYLYKVFQIPPQTKLTFATLSTEHELRALALTEVKEISLPKPPLPHRIGLVIQVEDVAPIIEQAISLGLEIVEPSVFNAPPNLLFTEQGFYDFDGQLIVLYETKTLEAS